jgi:hypothetical protein
MVLSCEYLKTAQRYISSVKKREDTRPSFQKTRESKGKRVSRKGLIGAGESNTSGLDSLSDDESDSDADVAAITKEQKDKISRKHPSDWPVDSGASSHMTHEPNLFRGPLQRLRRRRPIQVGGGMLWSEMRGTVEVVARDGSSCLLRNCLFVPNLGVNLISARRLCKDGIIGMHDSKDMYFKSLNRPLNFGNDDNTLIHAQQSNGLYFVKSFSRRCKEIAFLARVSLKEPSNQPSLPARLNQEVVSEPELSETGDNTDRDIDASEEDDNSKAKRRRYRLMHRRFGHYGSGALRHLHEVASGIKKIQIPAPARRICKSCKIGKMRKKINKNLAKHKSEALALVSIDVAGPFVESIRGHKYFLEIIDNFTRKIWTIPLKSKDEAMRRLREWRIREERRTGKGVKACRSDNAPELKEVMDEWEATDGVAAQYTTIASSHQNGPAERAIQTTENAIRTMTHGAGLPAEFWCFAAETDAYVRNRLANGPKIKGKRTSPEEAYTNEKQVSSHLRVWGCICYVHVDPKTLPTKHLHNKQADRGREAIFLGYASTTNTQYWFYSADLGYPQRSSSVEFDENSKRNLGSSGHQRNQGDQPNAS